MQGELDSKTEERLENAFEIYQTEVNGEVAEPHMKAGGQEYLLAFYRRAQAEGIADKVAERREKNIAELQTRIGLPEDYE